jgi:hypothetical protein
MPFISYGILASNFAAKFFFFGSFVAIPTFDPHCHWHGIPFGLYLGKDSASG